jgi:hypothetical protein
MTGIKLIPDSSSRPITWKETIGGIFGSKDPNWIKEATGYENVLKISKEKTIAIAVLSFIALAVALVVAAVAISMLFTIPVATPIVAAAIAAAAMTGALSQAALIGITVAAGILFLGGLIFGSASADALRRGGKEQKFDSVFDHEI